MNWIKNIFSTKSAKKEKPKEIKKIAILVGHGAGDSGAIGWNGVQEHFYNKSVSEYLKNINGKEIMIFFKSKNGWGSVYSEIEKFTPDLSVELHLNDASNLANGCEVLVLKGDEISSIYAKSFSSSFCSKFSRRIRGEEGVKWISKGDRGFANLVGASTASKCSILVEPFFINNKNEWISVGDYSNFLIEWIKGL